LALTVIAAASILAINLMVAAPSSAQTQISVQLNNNALNLNPPAIERAGRVFVPLRGVFEQMGASVVYENGQINATGHGHTVSLTIGSNQATVDGQNQTLDVAPFIIGASTYVPLRFLSQSLGAQVNWDNNNDVVMLTMGGGQHSGMRAPGNQQPMPANIGMLRNQEPQGGPYVRGNRSPIAVDFNQDVVASSLHITIDGVDVTAQATRTSNAIVFQPESPMSAMTHHVEITGRNANGQAFDQTWSVPTN
jgi:hypothetical protein